ncbi:MAG: adenylosuccinate lyase [Chloroflexota bacterium]|nr:adenylosuccinate lyase [Chloroflexota bacterium]MDQ5867830.1 adenylosuccinate lyase [Chloroflexota bacterium]
MDLNRYTNPAMGAIWSAQRKVDLWWKVEVAVAEAWAERGRVPGEVLPILREGKVDLGLMSEYEKSTDHDVIAFLKAAGDSLSDPDAARYVHLGLTSSDVIDTALALQLKEAMDLILSDVEDVRVTLAALALEHKHTVMIGRTHGVHAEPTTFGLKVLVWYDEMGRHLHRLEAARTDIATGKISGAVGTHANVPPDLEADALTRLGLATDPVSTQIVQRDRHAAVLNALALLASSLDKFATEIRHLARTEVREVEEPFGAAQQGSSAMPHKRNPHKSERISGLARVVRGFAITGMENVALWHERDISHSSGERLILPGAFILVDYMLRQFDSIVGNLNIYPGRMRRNLELTGGLVFSQPVMLALTESGLDRQAAYKIVQRHAMSVWDLDAKGETGPTFLERLMSDDEVMERLTQEQLREITSLERHLAYLDEAYRRVGLES